jgi:hypothetical protein
MKLRRTLLWCLLILLLPTLPGHALETVDEVSKCMEENQPKGNSVQTLSMASKDRTGAVTTMEAMLFLNREKEGRTKIHMRFDAPPDLQGAALLMLEGKGGRNDIFMYLPELGKTRRVTSHMMSGSMFGTDFSYEEFEYLQGMAESGSSTLEDPVEIAGRPAYVLVQMPEPESGSDYEKIKSFIDRETCIPARVEFLRKGDQLRKVLEVDWDSVSEQAGVWFPSRIVMKDQIEGTQTELEIKDVDMDADIPRAMFNQSSLERRGKR